MFDTLRSALKNHIDSLCANGNNNIFVLDVSKEDLWSTYIQSYHEDVRQQHNCNACRSFIKNYGGLVWVDPHTYTLHNIWEFEAPPGFEATVRAMRDLVSLATIRDGFVSDTRKLGVDFNYSPTLIRWTHLFYEFDSSFKTHKVWERPTILNDLRSGSEVFQRALSTISIDSIETVLELISTNSIYRGAEHKSTLESFLTLKKTYDSIEDLSTKDGFVWLTSTKYKPLARIRNTAIGTLLVDLSEGVELDRAVRSFESKVAPANYQRRTAVVSSGMIKQAEKTVLELGLDTALPRRHSTLDDLDVNDVLYIDRDSSKEPQSIFGEVMSVEKKVDPKSFSKLQEVTLDVFINEVLPGASKVEVLFEGRHLANLVSLTNAVNQDAKYLFKWDNHQAWCYNGSLADSDTKALVKAAGGQVEGILRCSLRWYNPDDLDIHLIEPNSNHIYFRNKTSLTGGALDVDMNAGGKYNPTNPVENIIYPHGSNMREGVYQLSVNCFNKKSNDSSGFEVEIEHNSKILTFSHPTPLKCKETCSVVTFSYSKKDGIKILSGTPNTKGSLSKEIWGLATNSFHPVQAITLSPNYWGGKSTGNKHLFMFIEGCKSDNPIRGFFNEFLRPELAPHRTAFELLGSKIQVAPSDGPQLSGLGFSSTQIGDFVVKVVGKTTRMLRVKIL